MFYFAYGSNMDAEQMKTLTAYHARYGALLRGYRLTFEKIPDDFQLQTRAGYATIVPDKNAVVYGIMYEIDSLEALDEYESYPKHYDRIEGEVQTNDGRMVKAWMYLNQPGKIAQGLLPSKAYLDSLLAGADLLPPDYVEALRKTPTCD